ncbi:hypothetical protein HN371_23545 [Candidatus Poribacteria bacterium]|nr:hypothetical protein [Candidatus Poribacteria bacterium]MBT5711416.1 hypothetical protein [Candidatus Poribacteria bacterium]MBT7099992.1 hypothetical protein [Candidatus Poribacteria bacterium]MBT7808879.1 hypothetical protein [Candidatus Poribacteria bacterium]
MTGRASVFSDDRVIEILTEEFVPVADNCSYTQSQKDAKGEFFRLIAEQGHYAGRTKPTATRQGLYTATADGELLASINTTNVDRVLKMLRAAIDKWQTEHVDGGAVTVPAVYEPDARYRRAFPEGGMTLRQTMRDLPRSGDLTFDTSRHNFDHVWLTGAEVAALAPTDLTPGTEYEIPPEVVRRVAQFHLVDQVRGEAPAWRTDSIRKAELTLRVEEVDGAQVDIRLTGQARLVQPPSDRVNLFSSFKVDMERGVDVQLAGFLVYDTLEQRFARFDMVATGSRWGATVYNFRAEDLGPAPIGFAFALPPPTPGNLTPPKFVLWDYFRES